MVIRQMTDILQHGNWSGLGPNNRFVRLDNVKFIRCPIWLQSMLSNFNRVTGVRFVFLMRYKSNLIPLSVKARLLVSGREFIVSRRKKLVPKMELGDSDNRSLVAKSGTCSISGCLAAEITQPPCSPKSWRLTLSDVF